jgi:phage anti-repressor protein
LDTLVDFAHKKNAKTTLENNFIKDEDYKILLTPKGNKVLTPKGKNPKPNLGGRPNEQVMLNVDNMCMLVKTEKSKQIRKYYVKLENIYNKIRK